MTLDEAIDQLVNVGEQDPLTIAKKVAAKYDKRWLANELVALSEDILADMARRRLGTIRRSAEVILRPGDNRAQADMKLAKVWIPGYGWKRVADVTADDLRKRAGAYDALTRASMKRAAWCRDVAEMIEAEGVETLGKLKRELPALPDDEAIGELMAA